MRLLAVTAIAAASLLLAGCSTNASSITLTYEHDGASRTLTINPATVSCDDDNVHGVAVGDSPVSGYSFDLINQSAEGEIKVSAVDDDKNFIRFEVDASAPNTGTDGVYLLKQTPGTVLLFENWDPDVEVNSSDVIELEGTVAAELHCDTE